MSICESCGKDHNSAYGSGRFCSSSCARRFSSKSNREETNRKISERMHEKVLNGTYRGNSPLLYSKEQRDEILLKVRNTWKNKLLDADYGTLTFERLRKRVLLEQNFTCNHCKLSEWMGVEIPLEIDHKDGDHSNNARENLEAICPNCHALTPNWRGRNKTLKSGRKKKTDLQIIEAFLETGNIRKCLLKLGLAAKGGNYGRVKRALTQNGISYK